MTITEKKTILLNLYLTFLLNIVKYLSFILSRKITQAAKKKAHQLPRGQILQPYCLVSTACLKKVGIFFKSIRGASQIL